MNKKLHSLWFVAALVAMMTTVATAVTSCSRDEADALNAANGTPSNRVCFTASLPQDFAQPATRAADGTSMPTPPDALHKLRCVLEVWSEDLNTLIVRKEVVPAEGDTDIRFEFELTEPAKYNALLWANFISTSAEETPMTSPNTYTHYADEYYRTSNPGGLKAIELYTITTNPEKQDAFCASVPFTKQTTALTDLKGTLTRAVTKLTIAEKSAENFALCKEVKISRYTLPKMLDVSTGAVSETAAFTNISFEEGIDSDFGKTVTIKGTPCTVLFTQYILAEADGAMGEIALTFTPTADAIAAHKQLRPVTIPAGVPLKRNFCVNAAGSLVQPEDAPSNDVAMTVDIDSRWGDPDVEHEIDTDEDPDAWLWDGTLPATADEAKEIMATAMTTDGSGTARNYVFTITKAKQLAALAYLVNNNVKLTAETGGSATLGKYSSAHYLLATDIGLAEHPWTPIGNSNNYFAGTFNGQGHTVSNMKVDITDAANAIYAGFFGKVSNSGTIIQNLIAEGEVRVNGASDCLAGGICGELFSATLQFCRFNGTVESTNSNISDHPGTNAAGGIVGEALVSAAVNACISHATVTRSGGADDTSGAGGLLGYLSNDDSSSPATCLHSAWNSALTADGIGKLDKSGSTIDASNHGFTTVAELNALLPAMNQSAPARTYEWKAAADADAYPILVPAPATFSGDNVRHGTW